MVRRFKPTLMDYVVIAINPALIMVLIGSLVYFLLEMFYQGQYPERLHFCLTLFIFAAVLIARISMEEGWDRAALFGAALGIAICLAMHKFVSYEGRSFEAIGWIVNYALIGLTWWCAIQLTWDCTLIDESQDASGEGLLQAVGLDREGVASDANTEGRVEKAEIEQPHASETAATAGDDTTPKRDFEDDMAWSTRKTQAKPPAKKSENKSADNKSWWDKLLERRRRPHAPGVWVVYFSLAALPIFGFGQAFIPVSNAGSRRYAFALLCVYVATALGLLLTTSFLGLRRYLRQRRLEMPAAMAGTWLVTGAALIVGLLVLTMLVPRPNAEYAISQLPLAMGSAEHDSSQMAAGKEGTRDKQVDSGSGERSRPENEQSNEEKNQNGSRRDGSRETENHGESKSGQSASGKNGGTGKGGEGKSGESQSGGENSKHSESSESQNQRSDQANGETAKSKEGSDQSQAETSQPSNTFTPPNLSLASEGLVAILKWIFYGAIVGIALWWSWTHREQLLAWLVVLLTGWRDLWGLFGRRSTEREIVPPAPRNKSFYDYADPFASRAAGQYSPAELVRYSFEAFEAWAHDQGWPRQTDQTAYEFARQVGGHVADIAKPARTLAELYSRAAYAPGTLAASSVEPLRALWDVMRSRQSLGI